MEVNIFWRVKRQGTGGRRAGETHVSFYDSQQH